MFICFSIFPLLSSNFIPLVDKLMYDNNPLSHCFVSYFFPMTQGDVRYLRDIEAFYNTQIEEMPSNVADLI